MTLHFLNDFMSQFEGFQGALVAAQNQVHQLLYLKTYLRLPFFCLTDWSNWASNLDHLCSLICTAVLNQVWNNECPTGFVLHSRGLLCNCGSRRRPNDLCHSPPMAPAT